MDMFNVYKTYEDMKNQIPNKEIMLCYLNTEDDRGIVGATDKFKKKAFSFTGFFRSIFNTLFTVKATDKNRYNITLNDLRNRLVRMDLPMEKILNMKCPVPPGLILGKDLYLHNVIERITPLLDLLTEVVNPTLENIDLEVSKYLTDLKARSTMSSLKASTDKITVPAIKAVNNIDSVLEQIYNTKYQNDNNLFKNIYGNGNNFLTAINLFLNIQTDLSAKRFEDMDKEVNIIVAKAEELILSIQEESVNYKTSLGVIKHITDILDAGARVVTSTTVVAVLYNQIAQSLITTAELVKKA